MTTASLALLALSVTVSALPAPQNDAKHLNQPCYEDNPLRALERFTSAANSFCPGFLISQGQGYPPKELGNFQHWEFYSACSCYEKTASGGASATATGILGPTASGGTGVTGGSGSGAPYPSASITAAVGRVPQGTAPVGTGPIGTGLINSAPMTKASVIASTAGSSFAEMSSSAAVSSLVATLNPVAASARDIGGSTGAGSPAGPIKPGSKGKRGIAYNYKSQDGWSAYFKGSPYAVWGSNWDDSRTDALDSSFAYVPTIAVDSSLSNANWNTTIPDLIQSGTTTLFG